MVTEIKIGNLYKIGIDNIFKCYNLSPTQVNLIRIASPRESVIWGIPSFKTYWSPVEKPEKKFSISYWK